VLVLVDVDELKSAEAAVLAGVERLRIAEQAPIGTGRISAVDTAGNDRFCESPASRRAAAERFQDITHPTMSGERGCLPSDARRRALLPWRNPISGMPDRVVGLQHRRARRGGAAIRRGVEIDITERKRAELALLESEERSGRSPTPPPV
jgi:PAS domain-containing protein